MADKLPKVLFLVSIVGHPRYSKRIDMVKQEGFDVQVGTYCRPYHKGRISNAPTEILGNFENKRYFSRLFVYLRSFIKVIKLIKNSDVVYAFEPDMAALALICTLGSKRNLVMEVGDIREILLADSILSKSLRRLDAFLASKINLLVATSEAFVDDYYFNLLKVSTKSLVIENKLEASTCELAKSLIKQNTEASTAKEYNEPIKIGYFGVLRCKWSWKVLSDLATKFPDKYKIIVAGRIEKHIESSFKINENPNIEVLGEYKSPDDLPSLYEKVDLVWACYEPFPKGLTNFKWAIPNRYYESLCFGLPPIVRKGTVFGIRVNKMDIGLEISDTDPKDAVDKILKITMPEIHKWRKNLLKIDPQEYRYIDESTKLAIDLRSL